MLPYILLVGFKLLVLQAATCELLCLPFIAQAIWLIYIILILGVSTTLTLCGQRRQGDDELKERNEHKLSNIIISAKGYLLNVIVLK